MMKLTRRISRSRHDQSEALKVLVPCLRQIARLMLADLLAALDEPDPHPYPGQALYRCFSRPHHAWLTRHVPRHRKAAARRADAPAYAAQVDRTLHANRFAPRAWRPYVMDKARQALKVDPVYGLPLSMWEYIGAVAWQDVLFQHEVNEQVYATFSERTLCQWGGFHAPRFASQTFWLLLALNENQPISAGADPWMTSALKQLATVGHTLSAASGWAYWWDQWLILHATTVWTHLNIAPSIASLIQTLPLLYLGKPRVHLSPLPDERAASAIPYWRAWLNTQLKATGWHPANAVGNMPIVPQALWAHYHDPAHLAHPTRALFNVQRKQLTNPVALHWDSDMPAWFVTWYTTVYASKESHL